jgi:hypothetical protein
MLNTFPLEGGGWGVSLQRNWGVQSGFSRSCPKLHCEELGASPAAISSSRSPDRSPGSPPIRVTILARSCLLRYQLSLYPRRFVEDFLMQHGIVSLRKCTRQTHDVLTPLLVQTQLLDPHITPQRTLRPDAKGYPCSRILCPCHAAQT